MEISRRKFLGTIGASAVGSVLPSSLKADDTYITVKDKLEGAEKIFTVCPFCAVGCGMTAYKKEGKIIEIEGDADHPINEGALCSKGGALLGLVNSERRLKKVLYRAPKSLKWEEKSWEWAVSEIAKRVKKTRDASFLKMEEGITVNRTETIASIGGAALDNEECYLLSKLMRSLGITYLEHQARI